MRYAAPWLVLCLAACSSGVPKLARSALTGKDGVKTVANGEIVNRYTALAADAAAGATTITVADPTGYAAGDLVLVVGVRGATFDTSDSAAYGALGSLGAAGANELWVLAGVAGNVLTLDTSCGVNGLASAYPLTSHPQVVRVPQYETLTVPGGGVLTGKRWDGATGGFIAVHVQTTANIEGTIDASGLGLRPGSPSAGSASPGTGVVTYRSSLAIGGEKGESIAGSPTDYDALGGRYGRGAPANGGGGGANATTASGAYSGQGTMLSSVTGGSAWTLDPGTSQSGGPGAGRGGYTYSAANLDATQVGPGNAGWSGDDRRQSGGLGGHAISSGGRIFLGGGGGAAQLDGVASPSTAGSGGGVVFLMASTLTGSGSVLANGSDGLDGQLVGNGALSAISGNGGGGGGGGGVVVLRSGGTTSLVVSAHGGAGGKVTTTGVFPLGVAPATGPGGGGAGGALTLGASLTLGTTDVKGGLGGTTSAPALAAFPSNGASAGDKGVVVTGVAAGAAPVACLPADVSLVLTTSSATLQTGASYSYTVTLANSGPNAAYDLATTVTLPPGVIGGAATSTSGSCSLVGQVVTCTQPVLLAGALAHIAISATAPSAAGTLTTSAQVSSRQDPNATNNSDSVDTGVMTPEADLSLTFAAPTATASNQTFTYTFAVTNHGPSSAPSLQVVDDLPSGVTFVSATGDGFTCTGTYTITCAHGPLSSGATISVVLTVEAPPLTAAADSLDSGTVSLTSSGTTDSTSSNDTASGKTTITPVDLSVAKADLFDPVSTGGVLGYTLTVQNPSNVVAHAVEVDDALPGGTTFVRASGSGWTCGLDTPGTSIVCTRPTIGPMATSTITVVLSAPASTTIVGNTATVKATATDPLPGNNVSMAQTTVSPPPPGTGKDDLSVTASAAQNPVALGAPLVYTVAVANAGPTSATGVQLVGVLPSTATFVSASGAGWTCTQTASTLSCALDDSAAVGSTAPLTVTMTAPTRVGSVEAAFIVTGAQSDTDLTNNAASVTTTAIDPAVQNLPPTLVVERGLSTPEDAPLALGTSITIDDPDSGSDEIELDITATSCVLTLSTTTGLAFLEGDGVLDPVLRVRAPVAALQLALSGALLVPYPTFDGIASLALHADDLWHDGAGPAGTANATLVVTVTPVDNPPIATIDEFTVNANVPTQLDLLANDAIGQPGQVLSIASVSQPGHGTATIVGGLVTYEPTPNFVGDDGFSYSVTDGTVESGASVTLHVKPFSPPTNDRLSGGAGCSAAPGLPGGGVLIVLALAYAMMRRSRNHSYCSRSAAKTDVGR